MPLTLALIVAVFARTRRLAGPIAAAIALGFAALSPDLLAHGSLVTTDLGLALFVFIAVAAFDRLLERATWVRLVATGLAVGRRARHQVLGARARPHAPRAGSSGDRGANARSSWPSSHRSAP